MFLQKSVNGITDNGYVLIAEMLRSIVIVSHMYIGQSDKGEFLMTGFDEAEVVALGYSLAIV